MAMTRSRAVRLDFRKYKSVYLMLAPVVAFYLVFHYGPMYGAMIAFKDFVPSLGIWGSDWVGFRNFTDFFSSHYFFRVVRNTFAISFLDLLFGFPAPIILALLLNEVKGNLFKRAVQTLTYLPHFISIMVICGLLIDFSMEKGLLNDIVAFFGGERANLLLKPTLFRPIYIASNIWKEAGWNSIIYLAALSGIDPQLYEAATVDGASRFQKLTRITLPGLLPTIAVLFILRTGSIMNVGFEKIILLYSPTTYEVADVVSSFVYRRGLLEMSYSYSAAVGLFNSLINFSLLSFTNWFSRRVNDASLW